MYDDLYKRIDEGKSKCQVRIFSYFVRLKTVSSRELVCDPQRGLYVMESGKQRLFRADKLKIGMKTLSYDERGDRFVEDELVAVEKIE